MVVVRSRAGRDLLPDLAVLTVDGLFCDAQQRSDLRPAETGVTRLPDRDFFSSRQLSSVLGDAGQFAHHAVIVCTVDRSPHDVSIC